MKKITILIILLIVSVTFIASNRHDDPGRNTVIQPGKHPLIVDSKKMDANTISTWFSNNGDYNRDPVTSNAGFEWPKGSGITARYASGLWLGAQVGNNNDTLIAMAEYSYEYLPGYTDNNGNPQGKDDAVYNVYKLTAGLNDANRTGWPNALLGNSNQNAPVYLDSTVNPHVYRPLDMGTQTLYYVYTDSYQSAHSNRAGSTHPLHADVQQVNFAFDVNGPLGQIAFTQFTIINRGAQPWKKTYLTAWTDDDDGFANDDKVGCDTVLNLGFTYNGAPIDPLYGSGPPAVGFVFLRGAIVPGLATDSASICEGPNVVWLHGKRQLGLTVFNWYANGNPVNGDPRIYYETYRLIKGLTRDGVGLYNPVTHDTTTFIYSGDPVLGTGWVQSSSDDQRFLQSTGPFDMNPGDTQVVTIGQVIARGSSNIQSVGVLRTYTGLVQRIYNNCFQVPPSPPKPAVTYYAPGDGKIYLSWSDTAERVRINNKLSGGVYHFQGYNVYQIKAGTDGSNPSDRQLLQTYDIKDTIGDIKDSIYDAGYGTFVYTVVQKGSNTGVSRYISLNKDSYTNGSIINGTPYYISITAYDFDPIGGPFSAPKVNESSISGAMLTIVPQSFTEGTNFALGIFDTIFTNRRDLGTMPVVLDPLTLKTASYTSAYSMVGSNLTWSLTRTLNGVTQTLYQNIAEFSGNQDSAFTVDGFLLVHSNVPDSGVVRDIEDPTSRNDLPYDHKTRGRGWAYFPPQNQWVMGLDTAASNVAKLFGGYPFQSRSMSISWPYKNILKPFSPAFRNLPTKIVANGTQFSPYQSIVQGGPLRKVKIVFGQQQLAYRYSGADNILLTDTNLLNTPIEDPNTPMVNIPFSVYAFDELDSTFSINPNGRQLNVAFIDADRNGIWDPDTTKLGKYQIVYIFATTYDPTPNPYYVSKNPGSPAGFQTMDIMYAWVPRVIHNGAIAMNYHTGDYMIIYPNVMTRAEFVPGYPIYYKWDVTANTIGNQSLASSRNDIDKVNVFPNPYYGGQRLETDPVNRFVYFSHLPSVCNIYIYTLNGVLIRRIQRSNSDPKNSLERWDLRNQDDIPVASGMYIILVDAPGIGTKVLKLAVFTPQERIDTF